MTDQEEGDYAAKEAMVWIESFVREAGYVLDWGPGFKGEKVVDGELGGGDDAETAG